ncbi:MAG TPA: DUF881 domain-containing protein [Bacillota bacterium]|nr:DUF881 domain-containing protein [Bacillota bacterium]HOR86728.1 DUF881 domain-containing protein [Bacillota bacterium]HPL54284.1 DUF881 domain-containing protein [Bacillota bacterium]
MNGKAYKYYLFILAAIIGFITAVQLKSNITYQGIVTIPKLLDLQNEINNMEVENKQLNDSIREQAMRLAEYKAEVEDTGSAFGIMKNELEKARNYSNYSTVQGPGIVMTLNDSKQEVVEGGDIAWYLIHDLDILEIINELKMAGAEAISINDERVTATTGIRCGGPTINIDGKRHTVPFVIKAIGDPKVLEASALAPESYIELYMEYTGIQVEIEKVENLTITGYRGQSKLRHQRKTEDGEEK